MVGHPPERHLLIPVVYNNSPCMLGDDLERALSCYTLKEGKLKWAFRVTRAL